MLDRDFNKDGQTYFELKEYKKAIECFDKAIEINPEDEVAWFNKGFAYFKLKDYNNSIHSFEKAISIFNDILNENPDDEMAKEGRSLAEHMIKQISSKEVKKHEYINILGIVTKVHDPMELKESEYLQIIELSDSSSAIRAILWNENTGLNINKGDIIGIQNGFVEYDSQEPVGYRINTDESSKIVLNPKLEEGLLQFLKESVDISLTDIKDIGEDSTEIDILVRVITLFETYSFKTKNDSGIVSSAILADNTGTIKAFFWNEKAQIPIISKAYKIENARARRSDDGMELHIGQGSRMIGEDDFSIEEKANLKSFEELESLVYVSKKIKDLKENDVGIKVLGKIMDVQDTFEFEENETKFLVRVIDIEDDTGSIKVNLWDEMADLVYIPGNFIKIQNPTVVYNKNTSNLELSVGDNSNIIDPSFK
jgi:replication factor A1